MQVSRDTARALLTSAQHLLADLAGEQVRKGHPQRGGMAGLAASSLRTVPIPDEAVERFCRSLALVTPEGASMAPSPTQPQRSAPPNGGTAGTAPNGAEPSLMDNMRALLQTLGMQPRDAD